MGTAKHLRKHDRTSGEHEAIWQELCLKNLHSSCLGSFHITKRSLLAITWPRIGFNRNHVQWRTRRLTFPSLMIYKGIWLFTITWACFWPHWKARTPKITLQANYWWANTFCLTFAWTLTNPIAFPHVICPTEVLLSWDLCPFTLITLTAFNDCLNSVHKVKTFSLSVSSLQPLSVIHVVWWHELKASSCERA